MNIKINFEKSKKSLFYKLWLLCFFSYSFNFFITNNPYMAYHSGRTAYQSVYISDSFKINPAYILLLVICLFVIILLFKNKFKISKIGLVYTISTIIASTLNGCIFNEYITVFYNCINVFLISSIAKSFHNDDSLAYDVKEYIRIYYISYFLLIVGIVAAFVMRYRYGEINLEFSRKSRGEITYWLVLGLHIWITAISLTVYKFSKSIKYLFPIFVVGFFQLAFSNRIAFLVIVIPVFLYIIFLNSNSKKIILFFIIIVVALININIILEFLLGGATTNDINSALNGRDELWSFYFENFKSHPLFGGGVNLIDSSLYTGKAFSEIGILKTFGEYGFFVGFLQLVMLMVAMVKVIVFLLNVKKETVKYKPIDLIMSFYFISCFVPFLLENHSRVFNVTDFFAWLSLFYILQKKTLK